MVTVWFTYYIPPWRSKRLNQANLAFPNGNVVDQGRVEDRIYDYIDVEDALSDVPVQPSPAYESALRDIPMQPSPAYESAIKFSH